MKSHDLDAIDIRILSAVKQYGQLSKSALADAVNLSPSAAWSRLNRLKNEGFIKAYRADIALNKIANLVKVVLVVSLKKHQKSHFDRFENRLRTLSEVVDCMATGGGADYVITVLSPNLTEFQTLMEQLLDEDIGIDRYFTYIATREVDLPSFNLTNIVKV